MKKPKLIVRRILLSLRLPRQNIFLIICALVLVVSIILIEFYFVNMSNAMRQEIIHSTAQTLKQAEMNILNTMERAENVSDNLFSHPYIQTALRPKDGTQKVNEEFDEEKSLKNAIMSVRGTNDNLKIRLFVDDDKIYARERITYFSIKDIENDDIYKKALEKQGDIYWQGTYFQEYIDEPGANVISCVRIIRDLENYRRILALLIIDIKEEEFYSIIRNIELPGGSLVFIIDEEGKVISAADKAQIGTEFSGADNISDEAQEGSFEYENGTSFCVNYRKIGDTGWNLIVQMPFNVNSETGGSFYSISNVTIISMLGLMFLILFISLVQNNKITKQIYKAQVREQKAQLKALQAQMNPHFMYNILDTINWMAIKKGAEDISFMVDSLANYFRLSLNNGKDIVSIADEIKLTRIYQELQHSRFGDTFTVTYDIDDEILCYAIPKLTLQPLVENALLKGIQNKDGDDGRIEIFAEKCGKNIEITVCDNGVGMTDEKIHEVMCQSKGGYGLYSINERLKLFSETSNPECGVTIKSEKGKGTKVKLRFEARLLQAQVKEAL